MVKLIYLIAPKPGMTRTDFQRHWLEVHAPIVKRLPHLERHVINISQLRADSTPAAIGGVAEQRFPSHDAMKAAFGTEVEFRSSSSGRARCASVALTGAQAVVWTIFSGIVKNSETRRRGATTTPPE